MESLKFTYQDEHFSLEELAAKVLDHKISKDELWQILMQKGNREVFSVLTMLGYEMIEDLEDIKDVDKRREAIANEDESLLRRKDHNESFISWFLLSFIDIGFKEILLLPPGIPG